MRIMMMMHGIPMGGAERNILNLLPHLKAQGIHPILGTLTTRWDSPGMVAEFERCGIPRRDMGARRMTDPAAWRHFTQILRDEKIDLIHTQDQDTHIYGALARRLLGMPLVMTRHVLREPAPSFKWKVRAKLVKLTGRYAADRIIAVSEAVRQRFAGQSHVSVDKIDMVYNGIRIEEFATRVRRQAKRAELGWAEDKPIVIMVAVLREGKGHEVLFAALPKIQEAVPNVQIKLAGDGPLLEALKEQVAALGENAKAAVEFMGNRMDVGELLGASDALVLPSWSEALPTVLIEAGAASLPVVSTNVGGAGEIVVDGKTGFLVPAGDSAQIAARLSELLTNPQRAQHMGYQAYERVVRMFSLERQAQQTIAVYQRVLEERKVAQHE